MSLLPFLNSVVGQGVMGAVGDLAGIALQGHYNSKEAKKNREFQADMANTQYQRAAADLEKAGLNRVLALGSPAASPSGSAASISVPALGTSFQAGSSAKAQRNVQVASETLLGEQAQTQKSEQALLAEQAAAVAAKVQPEIDLMKANAASALTASKRGSGVAEISSAVADLVRQIRNPPKGQPDGVLPTLADKLPRAVLGERGVNSARAFGRKLYEWTHPKIETQKLKGTRRTGATGGW